MEPSRKPTFHGPQLPPVLREAVAAHEAGLLDAAEPLYRRFLSENRDHPAALQLFGLLHSQRRQYDAAITLMRESLRLNPGQPEVANNLGNALSAVGLLGDAVDSYADALRQNPRYAEAFRNLGVCYLQLDLAGDARVCFERCVVLRPDDADAWMGLGNACKRLQDLPRAIESLEKALALCPDHAEAHHNLGVCLRMAQRTMDALTHFEIARRLGLDRAELHHNVASTRVDAMDLEGAVGSYREAIRRNPEDLISHRDLNKLLWEQDWPERYLESYREALGERPTSIPLRLDYAAALTRQQSYEDAERVLMEGLRHSPGAGALKSQLALTFEEQGRWNDALQMHAAAVAMPEVVPDQLVSYARALLATQSPDQALRFAEQAIARTPLNQRAIAYMGLCWRMLGNERDALLNDYENFVRVYDVPLPPGCGSAAEFNVRLERALRPMHLGKRHPPEQTLRGGTQTHGNLFDRREPEIRDLVAGITECAREYVEALPEHRTHPLLSRRRPGFEFSGSWSVRLARCGYHTMHVHPLGWISSAYYVQVPSGSEDTGMKPGWIKFGEPDIDLGTGGAARRHIQPQVGRLVLFPSYMWHGTVPFEADEPRTTVAFDVVPKN